MIPRKFILSWQESSELWRLDAMYDMLGKFISQSQFYWRKKLMLRLFKLNNRCFVGPIRGNPHWMAVFPVCCNMLITVTVVEYNDFLSSWIVGIEVLLSTTSTFAQNHNESFSVESISNLHSFLFLCFSESHTYHRKSPFLLKIFPTCIHFSFFLSVFWQIPHFQRGRLF